MRSPLLVLSILLPLAAGTGAYAQDAETALNMSSDSGMSCAAFTRLAPAEQDRIVRRILASAPPQTLAGSVGDEQVDSSGNIIERSPGRNNVPGTPLTAGELIGDCQTASPGSSLKDAYAAANSVYNNPPPQSGVR